MATATPLIQTIVTDLVSRAPSGGLKEIVNRAREADLNEDADLPRGILAGVVGGLAGAFAKTLVEQFFPVREPNPEQVHHFHIGDREIDIAIDTRDVMTSIFIGGAYGAATELVPEIHMGNGLALGSVLYGLNNAGEAMKAEDIQLKAQEENEANELVGDLVYGLVVEFVRAQLRERLN